MRSLTRSLFVFATFWCLASATPLASHAGSTSIVENVTNSQNAAFSLLGQQALGQAFTTDGHAYRLATVTATLVLPPGASAATVEIQLRATDSKKNQPGAILETWTGVTVSTSQPQDFTEPSAGTGTPLSPSTQYWLVVRALSGDPVSWSATSDPASTGVGSKGALLFTNKVTAQPVWVAPSDSSSPLFSVHGNAIPPALLAGAGAGGSPVVRAFDPVTEALVSETSVFDPSSKTGVRVAAADFDGDGIPDTVVGAGPGGGSRVKLIRGSDGATLEDFSAFGPSFNGGVFVAAGDVNGDGVPDIIVGADAGGGPEVKVFSGQNGARLKSFFAFGASLPSGVRVAAGDLDGDGCADIIVAPGRGGSPEVKVFSGKTGAVLADFYAYDFSFRGGVFVACGDVYGNGIPAIVTGPDAASGDLPVEIFSGRDLSGFKSFVPLPGFTGGYRVAAGDLNGDGIAEIIVGAGPGGEPFLKTYDASSPAPPNESFDAFSNTFSGGIYVAGAILPQPVVLPIRAAGPGSGKVTGKFLQPLVHQGGMSVEQSAIEPRLTELFTLTATPERGSAFSGWIDQNGAVVGYDETSSFRMSPGLTLQANFVLAPFAGLDATYDGVLVFDHSAQRGRLTARVGKTGAVAVAMDVGTPSGIAHVVIPAGQLLGSGDFQHVVYVSGIGNLRLTLHLELNPAGPRFITGTLAQVHEPGADPSLEPSASFTAESEEFQDGSCSFAGHLTVLLGRGFAPDSFPGGLGALQVTVSAKGRATFSGVLGDGSRLVAVFPTALDGSCAFFFPLYGRLGYLAGTLNFRDVSDTDLDGTLSWVKPAGLPGLVYPEGFAGDVTATGTFYVPPPAGTRIILDPNGSGSLALSEASATVTVKGKPYPLPDLNVQESATLDPDDFLHLPTDALALTAKLTRKSGAFSGSFQRKVGSRARTFSFSGVVLRPKGQTPGQAGGTFVGGNRAGAAFLSP